MPDGQDVASAVAADTAMSRVLNHRAVDACRPADCDPMSQGPRACLLDQRPVRTNTMSPAPMRTPDCFSQASRSSG